MCNTCINYRYPTYFKGSSLSVYANFLLNCNMFYRRTRFYRLFQHILVIKYKTGIKRLKALCLTVCFMLLLDPFLPRIVELATSSSDRQTKVAACELLHSMVLYMLGRSVQQPDAKDKFPMGPLYQKIFPSLLRLACDVELVARQLFEPLVMQLIHWLTNNKKFESQETAALLDAIMVSNKNMAIPVIQL